MSIIQKLNKHLGITMRFLNRKKKGKFNLNSFMRFAFHKFGNHSEAEFKYRRYRRVDGAQ